MAARAAARYKRGVSESRRSELPHVDALLIVSFGGPEGPADVLPFLQNVTRGRDVPPARLALVAEQYQRFGGVSPINGIVRQLIAALERLLAERGPALPVYWGNRNWHPGLADTVRRMADDGVGHALAFVTSAYSSYSSCRQYQEDIAAARAAVGAAAPVIEKLRPYWNHPGFIDAMRARTAEALAPFGAAPHVLFTAHSLPTAMAQRCDYVAQLTDAARLVLEAVGSDLDWELVYQSRSGPPAQPWLEPDVNDRLRALAAAGVRHVLLVPIGFVADHMEVVYDLDTQAVATAAALGIELKRAATVGAAPRFAAMIRELVLERTTGAPPAAYGALGPRPTPCAPDCCPPPAARPR
jgi:ferrochelatase